MDTIPLDLDAVLTWVSQAEFSDFLVAGTVQRPDGGPPYLWPDWNTVYLATVGAGPLLRLHAECCDPKIRLDVIDSIGVPENLRDDVDEGDEVILFSFAGQIVGGWDEFRCTGVRYVLGRETDPRQATVACLELCFQNTFPFFVSPETDGLAMAGHGELERWLDDGHKQGLGPLTTVRRPPAAAPSAD